MVDLKQDVLLSGDDFYKYLLGLRDGYFVKGISPKIRKLLVNHLTVPTSMDKTNQKFTRLFIP